MFPSPARRAFTNSLPFSRRCFQSVFSLPSSFPPLPHSSVRNKGFGKFSDLSGIIWNGKYSFNFGIVDSGIFLSFHLLLSNSSFPFGCNFHQVVGLRKWAGQNTRDDVRKEMLGQGFSMPKDFVLWWLHCFYPHKLCLVGKSPLMKNLCVNLLRFFYFHAYVPSIVLNFFSCICECVEIRH